MIALKYLIYFNYFILYVLSDERITVKKISIYSDKSPETKNKCFDSQLLAFNIIKENYDPLCNEFYKVCQKFRIHNDFNKFHGSSFHEKYIKEIIEKIRYLSVYESKILKKYEIIEKEAKNAQKVFYLHFYMIAYEFTDFWNIIISKHEIFYYSFFFQEIFENLIFNDNISENSIYKNINFDLDVRYEGGLLAFEKISYFKLLEIDMFDFFSTILAKSIVRLFERNSFLRLNNNYINSLKENQIIDINYNPNKIIDRISYIYEINIELNDLNIWFFYLKQNMIDIIKIANYNCYYIINFNVFNYVQVLKKIEAINNYVIQYSDHYYLSPYYISKQFFKIVDNRNFINYADECLKEISALVKDQKESKSKIKIIVKLKNNFISNMSALKNEFGFLENEFFECHKNQKSHKYWLVLDLLWLEAYTFTTMIRKFEKLGVILKKFSIKEKIFKSCYSHSSSHKIRLTQFNNKNKLKYILLSAVFNFMEIFDDLQIQNDKITANGSKTYDKPRFSFDCKNFYNMYKNLCVMYKIKKISIDDIFKENFKKYCIFEEDSYLSKFVFCGNKSIVKHIKSSDFFDCFFKKKNKTIKA